MLRECRLAIVMSVSLILYLKEIDGIPNYSVMLKKLNNTKAYDVLAASNGETKWCRPGCAPINENELGSWHRIDKCCKQLYQCSDTIPPRAWKYGMFNPDYLPRNNCECEWNFHECLKLITRASEAKVAGDILKAYFVKMFPICFYKSTEARCPGRYFDESGILHETNEENKYFCALWYSDLGG